MSATKHAMDVYRFHVCYSLVFPRVRRLIGAASPLPSPIGAAIGAASTSASTESAASARLRFGFLLLGAGGGGIEPTEAPALGTDGWGGPGSAAAAARGPAFWGEASNMSNALASVSELTSRLHSVQRSRSAAAISSHRVCERVKSDLSQNRNISTRARRCPSLVMQYRSASRKTTPRDFSRNGGRWKPHCLTSCLQSAQAATEPEHSYNATI